MRKFLWGSIVFESIFLVLLVVVTFVDKPQPLDRWLIVVLPIVAAVCALVAQSTANKKTKR